MKMDRASLTVGPAMDMPIMHDSDRYDFVRDIGSGNFGVARLMRDKVTKELVAVKYIERGDKALLVERLCMKIGEEDQDPNYEDSRRRSRTKITPCFKCIQ
ncbi:hypothetical protein CUMW_141800 [Citrus unshiu]|nr:hypothetical protein CUMW_141800 [Citrus unshiu]